MPAAVIGGVIAGVGAVGASAISAKATSKASKAATNAATEATNTNNALQERIYNTNRGVLSPYVQTGYQANNAMAGLLGLQGSPTNAPATYDMTQDPAGYGQVYDPSQTYMAGDFGMMIDNATGMPINTQGYGGFVQPVAPQAQATNGQPAGALATTSPQSAFDTYRNSTGYQFRLSEGDRALNSGWAARGMLNSGAAAKAAIQYGQNFASNEFGNYFNQLGALSGAGLSAGNALAGVGTNYANSVSSQNNALASTVANSAIARANANSNTWATAAGALGQIGGGLVSSYGGGGSLSSNAYGIRGSSGIY